MNSTTSWTAAGEQSAGYAWQLLGIVGPAIVAGLIVFFVVRALFRHSQYNAVKSFSEADRAAVREAILDAERKTVGELLPVIVERSDPHPGADGMAALTFAVVGSSLLAPWLPWAHPIGVLLAQLAMGTLGFGLARALPDFKRVFIFEDRATAVAKEQAFQEFYGNGLHKTEAATGVLIFVSLLEHRVIILADEGIDSKVDADFWADTDDAILVGIRGRSLRRGLIRGIEKAGDCLAVHFPWTTGDRNEIPDRVIVRRE
jgi:putative membrane protein